MTLVYSLGLLSSAPLIIGWVDDFNAPYFVPISADFTLAAQTVVIIVLLIMTLGLWFSWYDH